MRSDRSGPAGGAGGAGGRGGSHPCMPAMSGSFAARAFKSCTVCRNSRRSSAVLISTPPSVSPLGSRTCWMVRSLCPFSRTRRKMSLMSSFIVPVRSALNASESATAMRAATSRAASPRPGRARTRKRQPKACRKSTGTRKRA